MNISSAELHDSLENILPKSLHNNDIVFVCIGTDRSTGDSLAPMVGTHLVEKGYMNVYGTLDNPVHAINLVETIAALPKDKTIIAIDAMLGKTTSVGDFQVYKGGIKAGAGVGKNLPQVGDYSIAGIVNVSGFMEYFVLQNTRLSLVMNMANSITEGITKRFPLNNTYEKQNIFSILKNKLWLKLA
jgi:putative sporulation protein YyaC